MVKFPQLSVKVFESHKMIGASSSRADKYFSADLNCQGNHGCIAIFGIALVITFHFLIAGRAVKLCNFAIFQVKITFMIITIHKWNKPIVPRSERFRYSA